MERLKKKDADAGVVEQKLTDAQKAAIAEARSIYEARVAELQILHRQKQLTAVDPQEIERIEQEYRRDMDRFARDRDARSRRSARRPNAREHAQRRACCSSCRRCRGVRAQDDVLARIRQEGLERSKVHALFSTLTDQFGPRLAGTPAYKQSAEWARDRMREFGLADAKLEPWPFGRGWVLDRLVIEMVEPRYMPLIGYAEAWSAPTKGEIVATPIFLGGTPAADVAAMKDRALKGAIVMVGPQTQFTREDRPQPSLSDTPVRIGQPPWVTPRPNQADTRAIAQAVREAGVGVSQDQRRRARHRLRARPRSGRDALPSVVLAGEHYNMIARMLERGMPVKLRVNVQSHFVTDDPNSYNVIADLPGSRGARRSSPPRTSIADRSPAGRRSRCSCWDRRSRSATAR